MQDDGLQLGARGTGGPRESDRAESGREHFADDRGIAVAGWKVGVESWQKVNNINICAREKQTYGKFF